MPKNGMGYECGNEYEFNVRLIFSKNELLGWSSQVKHISCK